jgi:hypothetical protein
MRKNITAFPFILRDDDNLPIFNFYFDLRPTCYHLKENFRDQTAEIIHDLKEVNMMQPSFSRGAELLAIALACAAMLAMFAPRARAGDASTQPDSPSPDPKLKPQDVVRIVIDALSKNDANDNGIRTTWKFASPNNQSVTGPVERFIPMVKSPGYAPMLNSKSAQYSDPQIQGDQAIQMVLLTAADGTKIAYVFQLSRQTDNGPLKGCWMTDAVVPLKPQDQPRDNGGDLPV